MNDLEGIWPLPSSVGEFQKNSFILKLNKIYSYLYNSPIFEHEKNYLITFTCLSSFIVLKNFKKKWLSGLFKNSEKPCLVSRLFGSKTMKVNNSESWLHDFIQKIYIIFEIKLITIQVSFRSMVPQISRSLSVVP